MQYIHIFSARIRSTRVWKNVIVSIRYNSMIDFKQIEIEKGPCWRVYDLLVGYSVLRNW